MRLHIVPRAALGVCLATALRAQQSSVPPVSLAPLTLDGALREAHTANAELPLAAFDVSIDEAQLREARSIRGPRLSIDGDLHGGSPAGYAGADGRLQLLTQQPIYDGGAASAQVGVARANLGAGQARYRVAEKDLDLEVRLAFAGLLQLDTVIALRRLGVSRLETYLGAIEARRAAGEGVTADILKTRVQIAEAEAGLHEAERQRDQASRSLNDVLGRSPDSPLDLVPLPAPVAPPDSLGETWSSAPELQVAENEIAAAQSSVTLVAAERRPQLAMELNAGMQPGFGSFGTGINNGEGQGVEVLLSLSWPLFDLGGYRSRREQARLVREQAVQSELATRRGVRLAWSQARAELTARYREVQARMHTGAIAEDSYLTEESLYRGGGATALDVLDAYTSWLAANEATAEAVYGYRVAEAKLVRWGSP